MNKLNVLSTIWSRLPFTSKQTNREDDTLNATDIELVQQSWEKVKPISDKAAELFYGRLFEIAPEVKPYFKGDMDEQGKKLMQMISTAVSALKRLDTVVPAVQDLGRRHVSYGVKDKDYDSVGSALLWTLEQGLGEEFTEDTKSAWAKTYTVLADTMKEAAAEVSVDAAAEVST